MFPPCCSQLRNYYLSVLHSGDGKVGEVWNSKDNTLLIRIFFCNFIHYIFQQNVDNKVVQWSLRPLEFWEELLNEVESHLESLLNPEQLKEKNNIPGVRKIVKPHRYRSSPSPVKRTSRRKPNIHSDALSSSSSYEVTITLYTLYQECNLLKFDKLVYLNIIDFRRRLQKKLIKISTITLLKL